MDSLSYILLPFIVILCNAYFGNDMLYNMDHCVRIDANRYLPLKTGMRVIESTILSIFAKVGSFVLSYPCICLQKEPTNVCNA